MPRLYKVDGKVLRGYFILPYFKTAISKVVKKNYAKVTTFEGKSLIEKMPLKTVTSASTSLGNGCLTDNDLLLSFATKPGKVGLFIF